MLFDVIVAGWQETFRSTASRLAGDFCISASRLAAGLKVSCQPAGRRHFLFFLQTSHGAKIAVRLDKPLMTGYQYGTIQLTYTG